MFSTIQNDLFLTINFTQHLVKKNKKNPLKPSSPDESFTF